jgi:hypothetical protein
VEQSRSGPSFRNKGAAATDAFHGLAKKSVKITALGDKKFSDDTKTIWSGFAWWWTLAPLAITSGDKQAEPIVSRLVGGFVSTQRFPRYNNCRCVDVVFGTMLGHPSRDGLISRKR